MKRRRSLTKKEQVETITNFMERMNLAQGQFRDFMEARGIIISPQYLNDVIHGRHAPGPKFKEVFREITGIKLVDGLIEGDE